MAKILVLENDAGNANVLHLELTEQLHQVKTISDAALLEETIDQFHPELIVMDILLDQCDGRQLCFDLKRSVKTAHISILLITAMLESQIYTVPIVADKVMLKPFDYDELARTVNSLLPTS